MRPVAWNIQGGGGKRIASISDEIIGQDADVVVISEYVCGRTETLIERLVQAGWIYHVLPVPPERCGGVAILSRLEMRRVENVGDLGPQAYYRHAAVEFPSEGIEIRGLYAPLHDDPFDAFWEGLHSSLAAACDRPVLVVGDLKSGSPLVDTPGPHCSTPSTSSVCLKRAT